MHKIFLKLACVCLLLAIHSVSKGQTELVTMTVNSQRTQVKNAGSAQFLQIKYEGDSEWQIMQSPIAGFKYEPGFNYKISVRKERIHNDFFDEPAFRYTLLEILSKEKDDSLRGSAKTIVTQDSSSVRLFESSKLFTPSNTWMLSTINGYTPAGRKAFLIFDSSNSRVHGNNGCNSISGQYSFNGTQIKFSKMMVTLMVCDEEKDNQLEADFMKLLNSKVFEIDVENLNMNLYLDNQLVMTLGIVKY